MKLRALYVAVTVLLLSCWGAPVLAQWEQVSPGIEYRKYTLTAAPDPYPNNVFVTRMDRGNTGCIIDSCLAQGRLSTSRETVSGMASRYEDTINYWGQSWGQRSDVVVAINGDGFTSAPGPTNGQIIAGWQAKRWPEYSGGTGFVWKLDRTCFLGGNVRNGNVPGFEYQFIFFANGANVVPTNVNVARTAGVANELIVFTPQYHDNTYTDNTGTEVLVEITRPLVPLRLFSGDYVTGTIKQVRPNAGSTPIPFDHVVLSGTGSYATTLVNNCVVGDTIRFQFEIHDWGTGGQVPTSPSDWTNAYAGVGCFAYVVKNGIVPVNDWAGNSGAFIRNPRTAVAFNDNYVYFIVCDGRSTQSVGMTYPELGDFCINYLGAVWATNQDGGGSSAIWVNGQIKNKPSDGPERAVANGLLMVAVQPKQQSTAFVTNQIVTTSASTSVRLGPGTNYGILATVASGTQGRVLAHNINGVRGKGGYYWWKVDFNGTVGWAAESLLIGGGIAPSIAQDPAPQTVALGGTATFTVAATGTAPLSYQWQKNQANLSNGGHYSGVATATLTVSSADINDVASYRCVVTNVYGSATSTEADLTLAGKPTITQHPQPQNVCAGDTAVFTVAASGDGVLAYQWQKNGTNLSDGGHYAGVTTDTLTVTGADSGDAASYRCGVTNGAGTTYSNTALLTINAVYAIVGVGLTGSTVSGMATDGSVVAVNAGDTGYIWSTTNGLAGLGTGTTTAGVAVKGTTVVVGGLNGGNAARWDGNAAGAGAWTTLPLADGSSAWTPLCTSASASDVWVGGNTNGTTGTRSACRYKESTNSTTSLALPTGGKKDGYIYGVSDVGSYAGRYQYGNTSPGGSRQAMGGASLVALWPLIGAPSTSNEGVANTISRDGTKAGGWSWSAISQRQGTVWTIASPTSPTAVPFLGGGDNYAEIQAFNGNGSLAGGYTSVGGANKQAILWDASNGTRSLQSVLATQYGMDLTGWTLQELRAMSADGKVMAGNGLHNGSAEAWVVLLDVVPPAPTITGQPAAQYVCPGATAVFTVSASGLGAVTWRWQKDGVDLVEGAHFAGVHTPSLTVSNAGAADIGSYRCVVAVGCSAAMSDPAALTLRAATMVTQDPVAQSVCPGVTAQFTVSASGEGALAYQWQKDGADLSDAGHYTGATAATLTVSDVDANDTGDYRCLVTAGCGTALSVPASLTLKSATTVTQSPVGQTIGCGGTVEFVVAAYGAEPVTYRWQKDGLDLTDGGRYAGTGTSALTVSTATPGEAGDYRCVVTGACGEAVSDVATLVVSGAAGDFDADCDVDLNDFGRFQACFNGPNRAPVQGCVVDADLDDDGDVDLVDFGRFQQCFNGPNRSPACP